MPASQFTIYSSADRDGPGLLTGTTGSLITILNACLVNGYGSGSAWYKPAAGWKKPFGDVSASLNNPPRLGAFTQASGSQCTLFVNDSAPGLGTGKEARIVGWEYMTELTGSGNQGLIYSGSNSVGSGYGQFPLPSQVLTNGFVVVRKSLSADLVGRYWMIAADAHTMYMWVLTGDVTNGYYHFMFGDMYALAGNIDRYRCCIYGRVSENTAAAGGGIDMTSIITQGGQYSTNSQTGFTTLQYAQNGHFMVRSMGGTAGSQAFTKKGDSNGGTGTQASWPQNGIGMAGVLQTPNGPDNSFYVQPLHVVDPTSVMLRGRLRGLYHPCHPIASVNDGQIITGGGDYAGKTFTVIKTDLISISAWMLETSRTVETN